MEQIIITTTEHIPGHDIETVLGIARGSTVRARHIGRDILAAIKTLFGGEISDYTKLQADAREQALQRMLIDAEKRGAHAVVGVRIATTMVAAGSAEILAYGTAVKLK